MAASHIFDLDGFEGFGCFSTASGVINTRALNKMFDELGRQGGGFATVARAGSYKVDSASLAIKPGVIIWAGLGVAFVDSATGAPVQSLQPQVASALSQDALPASYFGIYPIQDSTAGFASMHDYFANTTPSLRQPVALGAGVFKTDKIVIAGENESVAGFVGNYGGCIIRGAGKDRTRIIANVSAEPVFVYNERGFILDWEMSGLTIEGRGASNPGQIGWFILGEPKIIDDFTGGVRHPHFSNIKVLGFDGPQIVIKGGISDALAPNDFHRWDNVEVYRASGNHAPAMVIIGQYGQAVHTNCMTEGAANNSGPNLYIGYHPANQAFAPSSLAANVITCTAAHRSYEAQPIRVVPTTGTIPTGLTAGVTYFAMPKNLTTTEKDIGLASTAANAAAGTLVALSAVGTGSVGIKLWATALANDEFTTEFPHLLTTGDPIMTRGSTLPTINGTLALDQGQLYWCVRTGFKTFKLADSLAHAKARTTVTITGGTLINYGFGVTSAAFDPGYSAFSPKFIQHTSENAQCGMFCAGVQNMVVEPYFGPLTWGFQIVGPQTAFTQANLIARSGVVANVTNLLFQEGDAKIFSVFDVDTIEIIGSTTSYLTALGGSYLTALNNRQQAVAFGATPTVNWQTGSIINFGLLTANVTSFTFTNLVPGCSGKLLLTQDGTGGRTFAGGGIWKGPAVGSGTANQKTAIPYHYDGTNILYSFTPWA